jgi:LuxR family maltose regulon positive regulatory protein
MDDANRVANSVVAHALEIRHPALLEASRAFQVELALRQGFLAQAIPWAKKFVSLPFEPMRWFYVPHMTLAKVLLAQNTNHSRKRAADLLQELYDFVIATHNTRFLIDILVLQALCHHLQKDESAATAALKGAFELAEPNGFIRVFVDQGPQMADLLERVPPGNVAVDYIEAIKEALEEDTQRILTDAAEPVDPSAQHNIFQPLLEPLTVRELEILEMLAQRLRNKEIADQLNISTETVKKHLGNIYGKLGTHKRLDAVEKALALGILSRR